VNVLVSLGGSFLVDTFDLYSARHRWLFLKQTASEISFDADELKRDLGKVLFQREALQDK
jgi:DNA primase